MSNKKQGNNPHSDFHLIIVTELLKEICHKMGLVGSHLLLYQSYSSNYKFIFL